MLHISTLFFKIFVSSVDDRQEKIFSESQTPSEVDWHSKVGNGVDCDREAEAVARKSIS